MVAGGETYSVTEAKEPIDVIVPTHGKLGEQTIPCISALYAHTRSPFHLIVVDDGNSEIDDREMTTAQWVERLQIEQTNITFIHSPVSFKSGNQIFNVGLSHCQNRFVALVMNSIRVEPDWDIVPIRMLQDNPKIGVIGIKCLKAGWNREGQSSEDGQIECAGIGLSPDGFTPIDIGRDEPGQRRNGSYPCWALQWAFALVRKEAAIGNLDEDLWQGFVGFDDIDNTLYLRYKGWEAWYCGAGCGYHFTHATRGSKTNEALFKNRINAEKFMKRWGLWENFKKVNPYTVERFPNGEVKFLCNINDLPLTIPDKQEIVVREEANVTKQTKNSR